MNIVDRNQMRKETKRLARSSNVLVGEAIHASLRRIAAGDYRLAIDDVAQVEAINAFKAEAKAEADETQVKVAEVTAAVNQLKAETAKITSAVNTLRDQRGGLVPERYTGITIDQPTETTTTYTYALVGGGEAVVTVTYTDNTKKTIASVVRA